MDNHTKNKITIKISGRERSYVENMTKKDTEKASDEVAATTESEVTDEFHWVLPNVEAEENKHTKIISIEDFRTNQTTQKKKKPQKKRVSISLSKQAILAIILAIIIGIGFGMLILNAVSKEMTIEDPKIEPVESDSLEDSQTNEKTQQKGSVPVYFQSLPLYIVQAGVFSTLDKAKEFASHISADGIPIAFIKKEQFFLFIGVGLNEEIVKEMGSYYQNLGIETYSKQYVLEAKTITVKNKNLAEQLHSVKQLFEQLLIATSEALNGKAITDKQFKDIEAIYKTINFSTLNEDTHVKKYTAEIANAYQSFTEYYNNHNILQLYKSQQALLHAIEMYEIL